MRIITAWDRRFCPKCERPRVHYRTVSKKAWQCIGTLPSQMRYITAACGKPVNYPVKP